MDMMTYVIVETLTKEEIDDVFKSAIPKAGHRAKLWLTVRKEKEEISKVNVSTQKVCATSEKSEESLSVGSSAAWQKESLGWVPFPSKPISIFFNAVLKEMHGCIWDDLPYEDTFRKVFNSEKARQYSYEKKLASIETKLNFITSDNMAAAGTLLDNEPTPYSGSNIKRNIGSLVELKSRVDAIKIEVIEHDTSIMLGNGGPRFV
ncbi:hypothetical protein JTE90_024741 [Oedothorax gibbosus]|uniref:Uncharacterized protein n=1 Tax=Oedothorax gibbosus TaxID=931172 RepID=A0AAV6UAV5_9ARAC|nr:hypothetical protein JTE90_024741 [Oedothorax gibbosus]